MAGSGRGVLFPCIVQGMSGLRGTGGDGPSSSVPSLPFPSVSQTPSYATEAVCPQSPHLPTPATSQFSLSPETPQAYPATRAGFPAPSSLYLSDMHRGSHLCLQISTTQVPQRCGLQGPAWAAPGSALTLPSLGPAGCCSRGLSDLSWFIAHISLVQNPPVCILRTTRRAYKTGPSVLPGAWSVLRPLKPWAESALVHSVYLCVGACWWGHFAAVTEGS